jgi:hypothetical protein
LVNCYLSLLRKKSNIKKSKRQLTKCKEYADFAKKRKFLNRSPGIQKAPKQSLTYMQIYLIIHFLNGIPKASKTLIDRLIPTLSNNF